MRNFFVLFSLLKYDSAESSIKSKNFNEKIKIKITNRRKNQRGNKRIKIIHFFIVFRKNIIIFMNIVVFSCQITIG